MKTMMLVLAAAAMTLPLAAPASAKHDNGHGEKKGHGYNNGNWHGNKGHWSRNNNVTTWVRYDWNRPDVDGWYYADRYYRPIVTYRTYRPIVVTRTTRIYRGGDNRYYCRRSDGTTGLIVGAALGGVIGSRLDRGRSNVLGTLLGAAAGGALGSEIDRGSVTCR